MTNGSRTRLWLGLGAFMLVGGGATAAASPDAPLLDAAQLAQAEGGESGEGGEGGEAGLADPVTDDVAYLHALGLVRGHLEVGVDLYRRGEREAAMTHMKHPGDELYADLVPAFERRGADGFAGPLERVAALVEAGAPVAAVEAAHAELNAAIGAAEAAVPEAGALPVRLAVVHRLVATAAEEYDIAVEEGRLVNAHEYQDALGFVRVAEGLLAGLDPAARATAPDAVAAIEREFAALAPLWPDLVPPAALGTDPALLHGAAARIEIAAQSAAR